MTETRGTLILLHRRRPDLSPGAFQDWAEARARLLAAERAALGFGAAAQVRQISRWNVADAAIRLSRAWVPAAFLSLLHGLAPPSFRPFRDDDAWDLAELIEWPDMAAMTDALARAEGVAALRALDADGAEKISARAALRAATTTPIPGAAGAAATFYAFRRRPTLSQAELAARWLGPHGDLVTRLAPTLGFSAYDQHLRADAPPAGQDEPDALAALYFDDFRKIEQALVSLRSLVASTRLAHDEAAFIDAGRSAFLVGVVEPVGSGDGVVADQKT